MNEYVNQTINCAFRTVPLTQREKQAITDGYTPENQAVLVQTAEQKKVLPVVGKLMCSLGVDTERWNGYYQHFRQRNLAVTRLLADIFQEFQRQGIQEICAFENYGAMLAAGTDIALYSSGDVDLYADPAQKRRIEQVMASFAYFPTQNDSHRRNINTEFLTDGGIIRINVAWKPLRRYLLPISIPAERYFDFPQMGFYQDTAIRLPTPDTLLYLCFLRIAVHGYSRSPDIRLYIDAFNATRNHPDWERVLRWAKDDGAETKFLAVAAIAHDLIALEVPELVLTAAQNDRYTQKVLALTYDFQKHSLKYDPAGLSLLKMEAASDNRSVIAELFRMLFPPRDWVKEYYQNENERTIKAYGRYFRRLL